MKPTTPTCCLLVMDGGKAHLFEMRRAPRTFRKIMSLESAWRQTPARDLVSDGSGRSRNRAGGHSSHTKQPRMDPREAEEAQFVQQAIEELNEVHRRQAFEELVLVADPRSLGRLRKQLDRPLATKISAEFNWNLAGLNAEKLEQRLWSAMGWTL